MKRFEAGSLVKHRTLGTGKVVAVEPDALHVFFPVSETRYAAKLRLPAAGAFLSLDEPDPDPQLEGLSTFTLDAASGRYALAANFIGQAEAVAAYLGEHPEGFHPVAAPRAGAPRAGRRERWRAASATWADTMEGGRSATLLDDGDDAGLVRRLLRIAEHASAVPGMVEREALAEALHPGPEVREFLHSLLGFLSVPSPARARFDKLAAAVRALAVPPEAAWPMVTFFPFVARPDRHVLLLPRSACAGASRLGWDLAYQPTPNWATYQRLRGLSSRLLEQLAPSGARDHVDVESFLHATSSQRPATAKRARAVSRSPVAKSRRTPTRRAR
ncbi:MAG TPA: hypothetical protein VFM45_13100 [Anaeromyxobacteraceae bacterium]|nr:hypothetical protein [Anaeromyxobacteraceae bacterium]